METQVRQRLNCSARVSSKRIELQEKQAISTLDELYQQGSARIRFPQQQADCVHAVLMNTAGGLTGNDHIQWQASAGTGSRLTLTTAACEKIYRTHGPAAIQNTQLLVGANARLSWLPQECIAFNGSYLKRSMEVHLDNSASCLLVESVVFGRQAMDECTENISLHDRWRVYREHRLLHAEDFRLNAADTDALKPSALHHYSAMSTLLLVCDQNAEWFTLMKNRVRAQTAGDRSQIRIAVTQLPNRLLVRVLASSSFHLRAFLIPCIESLNDGESIPTVWKV